MPEKASQATCSFFIGSQSARPTPAHQQCRVCEQRKVGFGWVYVSKECVPQPATCYGSQNYIATYTIPLAEVFLTILIFIWFTISWY